MSKWNQSNICEIKSENPQNLDQKVYQKPYTVLIKNNDITTWSVGYTENDCKSMNGSFENNDNINLLGLCDYESNTSGKCINNLPIEKVYLNNKDTFISGQSLCPTDTGLVKANKGTNNGALGINFMCVTLPNYDPTTYIV